MKKMVCIVVANFYPKISKALIDGSIKTLKSKCGVSPLITQPKAINPSYFFIFFEITTGISKIPGT